MIRHLIQSLALSSARHPWKVLGAALLVTLISIQAIRELPVLTSRQALLPRDTPVAWRMNHFLERFGAASDLLVVVEQAPRTVLEDYATELAARLKSAPEIAYATERLDTGFLLDHAFLLMPPAQLESLGNLLELASRQRRPVKLSDAITQFQTALDSPTDLSSMDLRQAMTALQGISAFVGEWGRWLGTTPPPDTPDWRGVLTTVGAGQLADGYYSSRAGDMLLIFVHGKAAGGGMDALRPLNERVKSVAAALTEAYREQGRIAPNVVLTGLPAIEYEEYLDIEQDIRLVIWTAVGLIAALIMLVVRSIPWALAIFIPMGLGALLTLAVTLHTVGHLTIITSSFLAILFGLGADYGIFTSSQIADSRRAGKPLVEAIGEGIAASFKAVATAAMASLLVFAVLARMEFPGFAELGIVAGSGVLLIVTTTWLIQPAIYVLLPPGIGKAPASGRSSQRINRPRFLPRAVAIALVVSALFSAGMGLHAGIGIPFDYDVLSLLPANSKAANYQRRIATETDFQPEVVIFTADSLTEIRRISEAAKQLPSIARVQSIADLFPSDADSRLEAGRRLADLADTAAIGRQLDGFEQDLGSTSLKGKLTPILSEVLERVDAAQEQAFSSGQSEMVDCLETLRERLQSLLDQAREHPALAEERTGRFVRALLGQARQALKRIGRWGDAIPLQPATLPETLRSRFVGADGTLAAYAFPAGSVYDIDRLERLVSDVLAISPEATGFPTTHLEFSKMVVDSFTRGTLIAIIVCLLWLGIVLRNPRAILLASLPLLVGGGWMLGLMSLANVRYNYANIIGLPLVIALAVDYGVWFSHRWELLRGRGTLAITLDAGKVIALAAGTELAGLGAITLASYRGVSTLGIAITLGLLSCLAATLLVAPAIGQLIDPKRTS